MDSFHQPKQPYSRAILLILAGALSLSSALARAGTAIDPDTWDLDPANEASTQIAPVRESAQSLDGLELALKHFPRPGAQPLLLIHGLAQNDRSWDSPIVRYNFARFMHSQGFDVWAGNLRGAGTPGFHSEAPKGPHHWSVDDYAALDMPALVRKVTEATGQRPFVVVHSLGAWVVEGYLAGLSYDAHGRIIPGARLSAEHQGGIRGMVSIAGVYNLHWEHPLAQAVSNPIRDEMDFYHSNYELELLARSKIASWIVPHLPGLPLDWVGQALYLPLHKIPFIGSKLEELYKGFQSEVIGTPIFSMFFYNKNSDRAMVRAHVRDGLEDFGPHVLEQLANTINDGKTSSYYHLKRPTDAYDYGSVRTHWSVPTMFVAGGRDRLASASEIYEDGYLKTQAQDKRYLYVENYGHMDVITGLHAPSEVMAPVAEWIHQKVGPTVW